MSILFQLKPRLRCKISSQHCPLLNLLCPPKSKAWDEIWMKLDARNEILWMLSVGWRTRQLNAMVGIVVFVSLFFLIPSLDEIHTLRTSLKEARQEQQVLETHIRELRSSETATKVTLSWTWTLEACTTFSLSSELTLWNNNCSFRRLNPNGRITNSWRRPRNLPSTGAQSMRKRRLSRLLLTRFPSQTHPPKHP